MDHRTRKVTREKQGNEFMRFRLTSTLCKPLPAAFIYAPVLYLRAAKALTTFPIRDNFTFLEIKTYNHSLLHWHNLYTSY